ncbi:MAG TPA: TlyA family RNA methyltransferase [Syntrophales bacterium]|nr:TlyA family RNA methyltransferase [Syntrophales bacterium]
MERAKERLDSLLLKRGLAPDEKTAQALILSGKVLVNGKPVDKVGSIFPADVPIRLREEAEGHPYVSRGGIKLKFALDHFGVKVKNKVTMDVGASTGGFTDCLLQEGAKKVYAIDVGYGQLAWKLRQDKRVVVLERTNIRTFRPQGIITEAIDFAVIDVSFISLRLVIPRIKDLLSPDGHLLALIKPQFEAPKEGVEKGGVVKDPNLRAAIVWEIKNFSEQEGFLILGSVPSPLFGPAGNQEFFLYARKKRNENGH